MTQMQFISLQTTTWFFVGCISKSFHSCKKEFHFCKSSQLEKTFWTSKQENMFYCLVFFLKHLYNTYTIVQNVDRYYIGVPYLEGIMDSACKQGSLWGLRPTPHDKRKKFPQTNNPQHLYSAWWWFRVYPKPDLLRRSAWEIFYRSTTKDFFLCTYT